MRRAVLPAIVLGALPLRAALAVTTDLCPDEAYYLAASRFGPMTDHPPLVPWLVAAASELRFLPLELRTRSPALLLSALTALAVAAVARSLAPAEQRDRAGWIAAWLATWLPLPFAGGFVFTPDVPAAAGLVAALAFGGAARGSVGTAALTSVVVGLAALGKVSVLPAACFAAVAVALDRRSWSVPLLWLAPAFAAAPVWIPSLRVQLGHAFGPSAGWSWAGALGSLAATAIAAVLLWSPPVVYFGIRALRSLPLAYRLTALAAGALVLVSAVARASPSEPNWSLPAALPIVLASAVALASASRRTVGVTLAIATAPTLLALVHVARPLPIDARMDFAARLHGWQSDAPPLNAPGIGPYGRAAEACVYQDQCDEIASYLRKLRR